MQLVSQKQAAEDKAEDKKEKRKEIREEKNRIEERIEEAKRLFKEMYVCRGDSGMGEDQIDATLVATKATLQAPLLNSTHESVAVSRR